MHHANLRFQLFVLISLLIFCKASAQAVLNATEFSQPPTIDGIVNSAEWPVTDSASSFVQLEPKKGTSSSEKTMVYLGFDARNIYVAFICYQDPKSLVARIPNRDNLDKSDDLAVVVLDTYNDRRTALCFMLNPAGTMADFKITDDGKGIDVLWDTRWQAAVSVQPYGWCIEMAIPFESLYYNKKLKTWGINFGRVIRHNQESCWWSDRMTEDFRVSQGGVLRGLELTGRKKNRLGLFPYGTLRYENSDFSGLHDKVKVNGGGDITYNLTSSLTSNATVFPDFATVEGDREQINLTRWELNFPDKRIFFQNGNELFDNRIRTFYSRRIGDIDYGVKMTGKAGPYNINVLHAMTASDPSEGKSNAFFSAVRIKRDFFKSSTIGLAYADKRSNGENAGSISADYTLNLGRTWKLTGQFVGSYPGDFWPHSAWFVRFARENNIYHYHVRYTSLGKDFQENVNQTGFIPDDDRKEVDSDVTYRWWINKKISYVSAEGRNNVFWSQQGVLRSWYLTYSTRMYMANRLSLDLTYNNEYKLFEKSFYNHFYRAELGYNTDEWSGGYVGYSTGRNFDRDFSLITGNVRFKPHRKLVLEYQVNWLTFRPDTDESSTLINIFTATYNFHRDLWVKVFAQNNTASNKYYLYSLFGWRFKPPFGALYLIYTSDHHDMDHPTIPNESVPGHGNILFLKVTYPFFLF